MKSSRPPLATLVFAMHFMALIATAEPSIWPQWRGSSRDGQIRGAAWPEKLDADHLRQVRRVELGLATLAAESVPSDAVLH